MDTSFFVFGGFNSKGAETIASFDTNTKQWKKLGNLNGYRKGHGVITYKGEFIVAGGAPWSLETERCTMKDNSIECTYAHPQLQDFFEYPEMMLVTKSFCSK